MLSSEIHVKFAEPATFCDTHAAVGRNYMRRRDIQTRITLPAMPGPWGRAVRQLRAEKGWTMRKLASEAGVSVNTMTSVERGRHTQTIILQKIADALSVPIDEVLLQNSLLQNERGSRNTAPVSEQVQHGQHRSVQAIESSATMQELQHQINILQSQLAEVVADREANRRRREHLSATRARKSVRARNARKTR